MIQSAMTAPMITPASAGMMSNDERRQLDINLNAEMSSPSLSVSSDITFRNVPAGVVTKLDGDGF